MLPIRRNMVDRTMPRTLRNEALPRERQQPPTLTITGNQIFPYLQANGQDQITDLIRLSSEIYRHSFVENFSLELRLHPPSTARSIRSSTHEFLGWETYFFDIADCAIALDIRLLPPPISRSGRPLAFPMVQVSYNNQWHNISAFLEIFTPACHVRARHFEQTARAQYDNQFRWWKALSNLPTFNPQHKVFRLMALPAEIRESIYGYVFPSPLHPFPGSPSRRLCGTGRMAFEAAQPNISLLRLNRQIYREASAVLLRDTVWQIPNPNIFDRVLGSQYLRGSIRKLHLALTHDNFIAMFTSGTEFGIASLKFLREMRLRELVLDFAPPTPVYRKSSAIIVECQRLIVDWILEAAEFWIVGHEGVRLEGWIKTKQKNAFGKLCETGVREFRKWKAITGEVDANLAEWDAWREDLWREEDGGVRVVEVEAEVAAESDGEAEVVKDERRLADHDKWNMPECLCEKSCAREGWSAED